MRDPPRKQMPTPDRAAVAEAIRRVLRSVRCDLGMDAAFVTEFTGESRVFRHVEADGACPVSVGDVLPNESGYCHKVLVGRLPELMPDTRLVPAAMALDATSDVPVGAHLGVPIRLSDGRIYGMLCFFSFKPNAGLSARDHGLVRTIAGLLAKEIEADQAHGDTDKAARIAAALASNDPIMVFQPICRLSDLAVTGAEALARFKSEPVQSPDRWFADAREVGLGCELERKAMLDALLGFRPAWERRALTLEINCSPRTVIAGGLVDLLAQGPAGLIVLELTEHERVEDYAALIRALAPLRARNVRIAIDDAGSGFSSMQHVVNIEPDIIKLDAAMIRDIDTDLRKRAMTDALLGFARKTGCSIVAEGIETAAELATVSGLGVDAAQGYFLGRPTSIDGFLRVAGLDGEVLPLRGAA